MDEMEQQQQQQQTAPWLADLAAKDEALGILREQVRQQDEMISDLRASGEKKAALSESLSEQIDRLSDRCDELSQLEQQQRQEAENQRGLLVELQQQYNNALCVADESQKDARALQQRAAELQIQLSEAQPDETLQSRIRELESRLAAGVPKGTSGLDILHEQLGRMERRMEVARSVGFLVTPDESSAATEDHELQRELEQALLQQSELQERVRGALLCDLRSVAAGDAEADHQSSLATRLQLELEHEKKERAAVNALVARLQRVDDERIERMRETAASAGKLAQEAEATRDAAIRELTVMQRDKAERDRGQIAEQRRNRRELVQVTQQLEDAKAELAAVRSDSARLTEEDSTLPPAPGDTGTLSQLTDILRPDDGAGPELLHKNSRRDVRQLRLERDRALRESRRLVEEHEIAKAQLANTTTEAIEREQQRTAELETQLADLAEQLADAEQRVASGVAEREHEAQLVAENLGSEVTRLKNELMRAQERAEKSDARLAKSEQKSREGMERMRESYEDEIGALEAQLTGASIETDGVEGGRWRKRAEKAEETVSKLQEELATLRTENVKLSELMRQGVGASGDATQHPEVVPADPGSSIKGPEESRTMKIGGTSDEASLAVQKELEEIAEDLMRQVESLLDENHKLKAKIEQKRARAKEKKRREQDTAHGGDVGLVQSTPQRGVPIAEMIGRPGATPAAQPHLHSGPLGREALSPQRMQSLLYGSNDSGASPNSRAASRAAVKTRRHAAVAMFDAPVSATVDPSRITRGSGNVGGVRDAYHAAGSVSQTLPLPTGGDAGGIAGLTAQQAEALAAARAAVLAPSPPTSKIGPVHDAGSEPTARERRRLGLLKLAQAIHGDKGGASDA